MSHRIQRTQKSPTKPTRSTKPGGAAQPAIAPKPAQTAYTIMPGAAYVDCTTLSQTPEYKTKWLDSAQRNLFAVPNFTVSPDEKKDTIDDFFRKRIAQVYNASDAKELYQAVIYLSGLAPVGTQRNDTITKILASKLLAKQVDINAFMVAVSNYKNSRNKTELNTALENLYIPVAFRNTPILGACILINVELR